MSAASADVSTGRKAPSVDHDITRYEEEMQALEWLRPERKAIELDLQVLSPLACETDGMRDAAPARSSARLRYREKPASAPTLPAATTPWTAVTLPAVQTVAVSRRRRASG